MVWVTPITSLLALAASLSLSEAKELEAYSPHIYYPDQYAIWKVGENHHVRWDATGIEPGTTNTFVYLVHNDRLELNEPLAQGFDLSLGEVLFQVPFNVTPGEYRVDLEGTSGDWSDLFRIEAA